MTDEARRAKTAAPIERDLAVRFTTRLKQSEKQACASAVNVPFCSYEKGVTNIERDVSFLKACRAAGKLAALTAQLNRILGDRPAESPPAPEIVPDVHEPQNYKVAWEALSKPLSWMHESDRLKAYWGWNLADIANDLIDRAYPDLRDSAAHPIRTGRIPGTKENEDGRQDRDHAVGAQQGAGAANRSAGHEQECDRNRSGRGEVSGISEQVSDLGRCESAALIPPRAHGTEGEPA